MAIYRFDTTATMKEYNRAKWYIDPDIVRPFEIDAENLKTALAAWREYVQNDCYVEISESAMTRKSPMYVDQKDAPPLQVGYVITGKTEFERGNYGGWSTQYIDLWVNVYQIGRVDFEKGA